MIAVIVSSTNMKWGKLASSLLSILYLYSNTFSIEFDEIMQQFYQAIKNSESSQGKTKLKSVL